MAPDSSHPDGVLYAEELSGGRLTRTRLVVLAACDSARGRLSGAGMLGLSRAFIAAGAARVVGSLWPVGDDASVTLFRDFYSQLGRGLTSGEALRYAQCAAITKRTPPSQWAAFQLHESGIPLANRDRESVK
jgi:CHAT domain-containing protein